MEQGGGGGGGGGPGEWPPRGMGPRGMGAQGNGGANRLSNLNKIYEGDYVVVCDFPFFFSNYIFYLSYNNVVRLHGEAHFLHDIVILSILGFIIHFQVHG